jgi:prolyl-tRNA editing enzyme YbaK/EbsC (Cys-tRNA(Pro) deacylase)
MDLSASARKVQEALNQSGVELRVVELPDSTRSAPEAAQAIGCQVGQIAKSLVFRRRRSGTGVLIIASGSNRVNEKKMAELLGEPLEKASADFVEELTGFAIGGVPPVGHASPLETFLDEDLLLYDGIWAAAGTPHAVFSLRPDELEKITGGQWIRVT